MEKCGCGGGPRRGWDKTTRKEKNVVDCRIYMMERGMSPVCYCTLLYEQTVEHDKASVLFFHEGEWLFSLKTSSHAHNLSIPCQRGGKKMLCPSSWPSGLDIEQMSLVPIYFVLVLMCAAEISEILALATCSHSHRYIAILYCDNSPLFRVSRLVSI